MFEVALKLLKEIEKIGYEAYIIGGYPRDKFLNRITTDIDICTNMPIKLIKNFEVINSYEELGSFKIKYDNFNFEITAFRIENNYLDKRKPSEIMFTSSFEEDIKRRDFTINTLAIDSDGKYIDLLNAKEDIKNKIVKVVGNIKVKLEEDPIRIIRAIRFKVELDFTLEKELEKFINNNTQLLDFISDYHMKKEYEKIKANDKKQEFKKYIEKLTNKDFLV